MHLTDGSALRGQCHITSGEPTRPHKTEDLERKYLDLAEPIWGRQRAGQLRDAILTIDTCGDVSQLVNFYP